MPPPPNLDSYRLSDDESRRIFTEQILPDELPGPIVASSRPLAVLAVGQTGAGKSVMCRAVLAALAAAGRRPVHLIADTYKTYHPAYAALAADPHQPHLASPATGPDARRWLHMAAAEAGARRADVLVESACRHPDDFCRLAALFRAASAAASYRVEVLVLAVPGPLSRLGILLRYCERRPEAHSRNLPVRLTPARVHDDSYAGLLAAAAFLDSGDEAVADQVLVVRRGALVAHGEARGPDGKLKGGLAAAVARERERPLTEEERQGALHDVQLLQAYDEVSSQLAEVRVLLDPLLRDRDTAESHDASSASPASEFPELVPMAYGNGSKDDLHAHYVLRLGVAAPE